MHKVRLTEEDKKTKDIKATQVAQIKLLRLLDGSRIKDRRSIKDMLDKLNLLSIKQTAAQIKIQEAWKASKDPKYPINLMKTKTTGNEKPTRSVRASTRKEMTEGGKTETAERSSARDTGKL